VLTSAERGELQQRGELPISALSVVQHRNVARLDTYGYNASFDGTLAGGKLSYGLNATAALARRESASGPEPLPAAPNFFGNARISYAFGGYVPTPALAVSYLHDRLIDRPFLPGWAETPTAGPNAEFRATLTGPIPGVAGLAYRITGSYATARYSAYAAGNVPEIISTTPEPSLAPIDRYSVLLGLRFDFGGSDSFSEPGGLP
jgi:hypothetical protein